MALFLAQRPGMVALVASAIAHTAEADAGDFEASAAELHIIHRLPRISGHHPEIEQPQRFVECVAEFLTE
jgi:hypothetical protein